MAQESNITKNWPLVDVRLSTDAIRLAVTYPGFEQGGLLSVPPTPDRIAAMQTFMTRLAAEVPAK